MKTILYFLFFIAIFPHQTEAVNSPKPLSVVIIGGGPAGLATAIEAHLHGADVTIIEKRETYLRLQTLFLLDPSMRLLKKWQVLLPQMKVLDLTSDIQMGVVKINNLEEGLEKRVRELGIRKILGEFRSFKEGMAKTIQVTCDGEELSFSYDVLVGADGAHSLVREQLDIRCNRMGEVQGISAFIPLTQSSALDISSPMKKRDYFIRKITTPSGSLIFAQRIPGSSDVNDRISQYTLEELMKDCNWQKEALVIAENKAKMSASITVILQQADTFSNKERGVILVGDAAAVASFFQGRGANTAFQTASIAGNFFMKLQKHDVDAYSSFNLLMKETTDELINDSKFLFCLE